MSTDAPRPRIEPVVVSDEFTVVGLYHPTRDQEQDYQSEAAEGVGSFVYEVQSSITKESAQQ